MTVIQKSLKKSWLFSNLVSFLQNSLIHLLRFLEHPDKDWQKEEESQVQYSIFCGGLLLKHNSLWSYLFDNVRHFISPKDFCNFP